MIQEVQTNYLTFYIGCIEDKQDKKNADDALIYLGLLSP